MDLFDSLKEFYNKPVDLQRPIKYKTNQQTKFFLY
jgi:hypothetical protein